MPDAFSRQGAGCSPLAAPCGPGPTVGSHRKTQLPRRRCSHSLPSRRRPQKPLARCQIPLAREPRVGPSSRRKPLPRRNPPFPRASFRGLLGPARLIQWGAPIRASGRLGPRPSTFNACSEAELLANYAVNMASTASPMLREGARFFYDGAASVHHRQHAVDRYLTLVRSLGAPIPNVLQWPLPDDSAGPGLLLS